MVAGPGVAWPKSRFSGCELAAQAMESFPGCPPGPVALAVAARRASVWRRAKMARTAPGRQRLKTRWPECGRSSRRPGRCTPACPAGRSRRRSGAPQGNRPIRPHPGPCKCQTHRPFILVPAGHSMRPVQAQSKRAPTAPRCADGTSTAVTAPETDMNHIHGTPASPSHWPRSRPPSRSRCPPSTAQPPRPSTGHCITTPRAVTIDVAGVGCL